MQYLVKTRGKKKSVCVHLVIDGEILCKRSNIERAYWDIVDSVDDLQTICWHCKAALDRIKRSPEPRKLPRLRKTKKEVELDKLRAWEAGEAAT